MVLQVPNAPDHNDIGRALDTIFTQWPDLPEDAVAHVFGEHSTQTFGRHTVPYISPERVQESTWVRILIAKDRREPTCQRTLSAERRAVASVQAKS